MRFQYFTRLRKEDAGNPEGSGDTSLTDLLLAGLDGKPAAPTQAKVEKKDEAAVTEGGEVVEGEPEAGGDAGAPAGGEDAPEGETPEQEKARLLKENDELKRATDAEELERLRAENAKLKEGKGGQDARAPGAAPAAADGPTSADLDKLAGELAAALRFCAENWDGYEGPGADGKTISLEGTAVRKRFAELQEELAVKLPAERGALAKREQTAAAHRAAYPTHFDPKHQDAREVAEIAAEYPALKGDHKALAQMLAGRRATKTAATTTTPATTHAKVPPVTKAAVTTAPSATRKTVALSNFDKEGGTRHALAKDLAALIFPKA